MALSELLRVFVLPQTTTDIAAFYVVWTCAYMTINIIWDVVSKRTPAFHISALDTKIPTLWNGMTFASSLLLIVSPFDAGVRMLVDAAVAPIILAGFAGLLVSISSICPYRTSMKTADATPSP